ncbi:MAG TPA: hypothetical protein VI522_05980, partial [Gammaproteobacteria bacterium]|nr:hypothetical protein [Gammaproteobacteria bacterium]
MKNSIKTFTLGVAIGALLLAAPLPGLASNGTALQERPNWFEKSADLLVARPVLFGLTIVGSAVFLVTSPITYGGGHAQEAY